MDKEKIFSDTLRALENYLRKEDRVYWGMLSGKVKGAISRILTEDRYYFVRYTVDDDMERFYVSIYPQIICEKHYLRMLHAYVNSKTSDYKSGRVDVDNITGEVKIVAESSIVSHPITESEIDDLEHLAVHIAEELNMRLSRLAHGILIDESDPEIWGPAERKMDELKKKAKSENDENKGIFSGLFDFDALDDDDGPKTLPGVEDGGEDSSEKKTDDGKDSDVSETSEDKKDAGTDADTDADKPAAKSFDELFPDDDDDSEF